MKVLLIYVIGTFLLSTTFAWSISDAVYNVFEEGEEAITKEVRNIEYGATTAIHEAEKYVQNAVNKVRDFGVVIGKNVQHYVEATEDEIVDLSKNVAQLEQILTQSDPNDPEANSLLYHIKSFVNRTEKLIQTELNDIEKRIEIPAKKGIESILDGMRYFRLWANDKLRKLKPTVQKMAQPILKKVFDESSRRIENCSSKTIEPIHKLFAYANETIDRAASVIRDVITSIQTCTSMKEGILEVIKSCVKAVVLTGEDAYTLIKKDIGSFERRMAQIGAEAVYNLKCFITVEEDWKKEQSTATANIERIVQKYYKINNNNV